MSVFRTNEAPKDVNESALYMTDQLRKCIETGNYAGMAPYLKWLAYWSILAERAYPNPMIIRKPIV